MLQFRYIINYLNHIFFIEVSMLVRSLFITKRAGSVLSALFSKAKRAQVRSLHTQTWEFTDNHRGITGVYHHTVSSEDTDKDPNKISDELYNTIVKHPDSLVFLTEKSRLLRRSDDNPNFYLPMEKSELSDLPLMINLVRKQWLRPRAGHICMAITDNKGSFLDDTHVSLRPTSERVLSGKTALHPHLYEANMPSELRLAKHSSIAEEVSLLASKMLHNRSIIADLTVIPLVLTNVEITEFLGNIRSARAIKLYNLCSLIVKKKDIETITDKTIQQYVEELKQRAAQFPELQCAASTEFDTVLAALACTHAVAKACYGDTHAIDNAVGPDQDTQTAAVYCAMALLGSDRFFDFAKKINFLDDASDLTKTNKL
jgi:hypothetical protein